MKKKDLNEENIEEFDDIEDVEDEVEDVDDVEDIEDLEVEAEDDDDLEEDKPSKKSKKAPKGGKKKGGKKKGIIITAIVLVVVLALAAVVYWVVLPMISGEEASADYTGTVGNVKPTGITAHTAINKNMTSTEMLLAVVDNYYNVDYAANICINGGVVTKVGPLNVNQSVNSLKIRNGKTSDSDASYFVYSKSLGIANMWEEYYTTGSTVSYRKASKMTKQDATATDAQRIVVSEWNDKVVYASLAKFIEATSTDFTKIWSYNVTTETIASDSDSKVTFDSKEGCYYFTVKPDLETSVAAYVEVMKYQLGSNMGMTVNSLTFTQLELEFCVWDNGFIRYLAVHESYQMDLTGVPVIRSLSMGITNNCMNEYTFDSSETLPYDTGAKTKTVDQIDITKALKIF